MIQRIQSVYLLLTALLSALLFFVPLYRMESLQATVLEPGFYLSSNVVYMALNTMAGIFSLAALFLFRNRSLQLKVCSVTLFILCIFIGSIFYFADHLKAGAGVHYTIGCYVPLLQLVLVLLGMRAIRKDEALVRSADRLR